MSVESGPHSLVELLQLRARTHADLVAVSDGARSLTYAELDVLAATAVEALRQRGVCAGDRVVVIGRNSTEWVVWAFGVLAAGGTVVPMGHGSSREEQQRAVDSLVPRLVIADDGVWEIDGCEVMRLERPAGSPGSRAQASVDADSAALVMSTSGTTGTVKHVEMTHRQVTRLYAGVSAEIGLREDDRLLGAVPLAHSFGFNGVLVIAFCAGAAVRLAGTYDRDALADLVRREELTVLAGPPTIYHDLAAAGPARVGRSVRLAITGSSEIFADRIRATCDELGIPEVVVGYGMTESCGTVALGRIPEHVETPTPLMTPVDGVEVRIVDLAGRERPTGEQGRLLIRGYNVLQDYAAGTPAVLHEGWFDTGDIGRLDEAGRLEVVGRSRDTVIVSGFNVVPQEVERALAAHPGVEGVVVVGLPDARQGERLVACVVPGPGQAPEPADLMVHARARISAYKVPRDYRMIAGIPLTATGKVSRAAVRRALAGDEPGNSG